MKTLSTLVAAGLTLASSLAFAHGMTHFNFGEPGVAAKVTKTFRFQTPDTMRFVTTDTLKIRRGDTVKFVVTNTGRVPHEFSLGDVAFQKQHAEMMRAMPNMKHEDPNTLVLAPGETKTLIWSFSTLPPSGVVQIGCHVPGHFEAGMKYDLVVKP